MDSWPPAAGLTTKLVPRDKAILQISHATTIQANTETVFRTLLDTASYSRWNTWVPTVTLVSAASGSAPASAASPSPLLPGTVMDFHVRMDMKKPQKPTIQRLEVTDVSTPAAPSPYLTDALLRDASFAPDAARVYRVCWAGAGGLSKWGLLRTERVHEVISNSEDECEVRTWEVMGGVLAYVVRLMYAATLTEMFKLWCEDLKRHCEGGGQVGE